MPIFSRVFAKIEVIALSRRKARKVKPLHCAGGVKFDRYEAATKQFTSIQEMDFSILRLVSMDYTVSICFLQGNNSYRFSVQFASIKPSTKPVRIIT